MVHSLALTHLLFGCIVFGCLADNVVSIASSQRATCVMWRAVEIFFRKMLRWSLKCKRDIRTSFLYLLADSPSVQVLTFKRCLRFFSKLEDPSTETRFVGEILNGISNLPFSERSLLGPNMFVFWPEFVA